MKIIKNIVLVFLLSFVFSSCISNPIRQVQDKFDTSVDQTVVSTPGSPSSTLPPVTKTSGGQITHLEQQKTQILVENERLKQEIEQKQRQIEENKKQVEVIQKQIELEKQKQMQLWANWIAGVSLVLGIVAFVASLFLTAYPLIPRILRYTSLILVSIAALSFFFAIIIPYLFWITIGFVVLLVGSFAYLWFKDRKSLCQVVETVEKYKTEIPNYKNKFREMIDSDVDEFINNIRKQLKEKKEGN